MLNSAQECSSDLRAQILCSSNRYIRYAVESVGHAKVEDFPELHKIVKDEVSLSQWVRNHVQRGERI